MAGFSKVNKEKNMNKRYDKKDKIINKITKIKLK